MSKVKIGGRFFGLLSETKVNPTTAIDATAALRGPDVQQSRDLLRQLEARVAEAGGRKGALQATLAANPLPEGRVSKDAAAWVVGQPLTVKSVDAQQNKLRRDARPERFGQGHDDDGIEQYMDHIYGGGETGQRLFQQAAEATWFPRTHDTWEQSYKAWLKDGGESEASELDFHSLDVLEQLKQAGIKPQEYPYETYQRLKLPGTWSRHGPPERYSEHAVFTPADTGLQMRVDRGKGSGMSTLVSQGRFLEDSRQVPMHGGHYPLFTPLSERRRLAGHFRAGQTPEGLFVHEVQPDTLQNLAKSMKASPVLNESPLNIAQAALGLALRNKAPGFYLPSNELIRSVRDRKKDYSALYDRLLPEQFLEPLAKASGQRVHGAPSEWPGTAAGDWLGLKLPQDLREEWLRKGIPYGKGGMVKQLRGALSNAFESAAAPVARPRWANEVDAGPALMDVVKPKGGAWNETSVTRAMDAVRSPPRTLGEINSDRAGAFPPRTAEEHAIRAIRVAEQRARYPEVDAEYRLKEWIDRSLRNYVTREMATPEDPLRALAERGVVADSQSLERGPQSLFGGNFNKAVRDHRRKAKAHHVDWADKKGVPAWSEDPRVGESMGTSNLARAWEDAADRYVEPAIADMDGPAVGPGVLPKGLEHLRKGERFARLPRPADMGRNLGFDHLADELSNALSPNSGLPRHLALKPESLSRLSVPQAVQRVHDINEWRKAQAAKAAHEANASATLIKEYPETGLRWNQLDKPGQFKAESDSMGHSVRGYEKPELGGSAYYSHGGWDAIQSGKAKVFSLRDAKHEPHVTVEWVAGEPQIKADVPMTQGFANRITQEYPQSMTAYNLHFKNSGQHPMAYGKDFTSWLKTYDPALHAELTTPGPPRITQIKGKGNARPKEEYQDAITDFIRTQGPFSNIGDLGHTNLVDLKNRSPESLIHDLEMTKQFPFGKNPNAMREILSILEKERRLQPYMPKVELRALIEPELERYLNSPTPQTKVSGGRVFSHGGSVVTL